MASILIADDDAHIVRVMAIWLRRHGHSVTTARNGREALGHLEERSIDVIITDANMPILDGVELAGRVREKFGTDLPILMLTARCDQKQLGERLASDAVQVFPKPFLPSQLVAEINRVLNPIGASRSERGGIR